MATSLKIMHPAITALLSGAIGMLSLSAAAQNAPTQTSSTTTAEEALEEVVVTGSRIAQPGITSISPLAVVSDEDIKLSGTANMEAVVNNMPQVFASQTQAVNNGGGVATLNLRGLGPSRTLVLVDGRRLMPGDPNNLVADLTNVPSALVDRVEIMTGGASAVYGSDAVAGVVNFMMKKNFEGLRLDAQYGFANHRQSNGEAQAALDRGIAQGLNVEKPGNVGADSQRLNFSAIVGTNSSDNNGNVTAYLTYRRLDPTLAGSRDFSACSVSTVNAAPGVNNRHDCAGSSTSAYGNIQLLNGSNSGQAFADNVDGSQTFIPYSAALNPKLNFSIGQYNYLQRDDQLYTAGALAHYEVNKHADIYTNIMFADDKTVGQLAPNGLLQPNTPPIGYYTINCDNPLMSAQQRSLICAGLGATADARARIAYRLNFGPAAQFTYGHTNYKLDIGSRGNIAEGWDYDAYFQYGYSDYQSLTTGQVSVTRAQRALQVDAATGRCKSAVDGTDPNCVPLNIFQYGGANGAALKYILQSVVNTGYTKEKILSGAITGDLGTWGVKSPWADSSVKIAIGAEKRREELSIRLDNLQLSGELGGAASIPRPDGAFDVNEVFGELRVPLIQDRPGIKELSLEGGYRYSDYSTAAGVTNTFKVGFEYAPVQSVRIRGGYNRAVRAPNLNELFAPQATGAISGTTDPCAAGTLTATAAQCALTGVPVDAAAAALAGKSYWYGNVAADCPSATCNGFNGGNTQLSPEVADTKTFGVVLTPGFASALSMTFDYFDIKVKNIVGSLGRIALGSCINTGDPTFCSLIQRDNLGSLSSRTGYIVNTLQNFGYLRTSGLDVETNYSADMTDLHLPDWGKLNFKLFGTKLMKYEVLANPLLGSFDCAGLFGSVCNQFTTAPLPTWRHQVRIGWSSKANLSINANWRHLSAVKLDRNTSNPNFPISAASAADARIPDYDYLDLAAEVKVGKQLRVRAGMNNVFDRNPPLVDTFRLSISSPGSYGYGNTYPGTYDVLGRVFFAGFSADF